MLWQQHIWSCRAEKASMYHAVYVSISLDHLVQPSAFVSHICRPHSLIPLVKFSRAVNVQRPIASKHICFWTHWEGMVRQLSMRVRNWNFRCNPSNEQLCLLARVYFRLNIIRQQLGSLVLLSLLLVNNSRFRVIYKCSSDCVLASSV